MNRLLTHPALALVVATGALVTALGVPAEAARLLTGADVKDGSLAGRDVRDGSLTGADLRPRSIAAGALAPGTLDARALPRKRVVATVGADREKAAYLAPPVVLYRRGPLTVSAKCFTDNEFGLSYAETYVTTTVPGVVFSSRKRDLSGGGSEHDFLDPTDDVGLGLVERTIVGWNDGDSDSPGDSDFVAFAPDGTTLRGWTGVAVKRGDVEGGNGAYGAGDVCLFTGAVFSS
jgi:hypothetical protein